jgi:hypothetical protein
METGRLFHKPLNFKHMKHIIIIVLFVLIAQISSATTNDKWGGVNIISQELTSPNGSFIVNAYIICTDTVTFTSNPSLQLAAAWPYSAPVLTGQTNYPGDSIPLAFSVNYPINQLPFFPLKSGITIEGQSIKDTTVSGNSNYFHIYFTSYNTIEIWNQSDFDNLPREWIQPEYISDTQRISISKDDIPDYDLVDLTNITSQRVSNLMDSTYAIKVKGLPYKVLSNKIPADTLTAYLNYDDGPDSMAVTMRGTNFKGTVSGTVMAEIQNDFGIVMPIPLAGIKVILREEDMTVDDYFGFDFTNDQGEYSITYNKSQSWTEGDNIELYIEVESKTESAYKVHCSNIFNYPYKIRKYKLVSTGNNANLRMPAYFYYNEISDSKPYRLANWAYRGKKYFVDEGIALPEDLKIDKNGWLGSYYDGMNTTINLDPDDTKNETTIYHEFGHYVMDQIYPGGFLWEFGEDWASHKNSEENCSKIAWTEGWAEFVGYMLDARYWWVDHEYSHEILKYTSGATELEQRHETRHYYSEIKNGIRSEYYISCALYDLWDGANKDLPDVLPTVTGVTHGWKDFINTDEEEQWWTKDLIELSLADICAPLYNEPAQIIEYFNMLIDNKTPLEKSDIARAFAENHILWDIDGHREDEHISNLSSDRIFITKTYAEKPDGLLNNYTDTYKVNFYNESADNTFTLNTESNAIEPITDRLQIGTTKTTNRTASLYLHPHYNNSGFTSGTYKTYGQHTTLIENGLIQVGQYPNSTATLEISEGSVLAIKAKGTLDISKNSKVIIKSGASFAQENGYTITGTGIVTFEPGAICTVESPTNLGQKHEGNNTIKLTWDDQSQIESEYIVERMKYGSCFTKIVTLPANSTSYNDNSIETEKRYRYRVKAKNPASVSKVCEVNTYEYSSPQKPTNLTAQKDGSGKVTLAWSDNSSIETGYVIERALKGSYSYTVIKSLGANTTLYTHNSGSVASNYQYRVKAIRNNGYSAYSNVAVAECGGVEVLVGNVTHNSPAYYLCGLEIPMGKTISQNAALYLAEDIKLSINGGSLVLASGAALKNPDGSEWKGEIELKNGGILEIAPSKQFTFRGKLSHEAGSITLGTNSVFTLEGSSSTLELASISNTLLINGTGKITLKNGKINMTSSDSKLLLNQGLVNITLNNIHVLNPTGSINSHKGISIRSGSNVSVTNCSFRHGYKGLELRRENGDPRVQIKNCTFKNNGAYGFYGYKGDYYFENCLFENNSSNGFCWYSPYESVTFFQCDFYRNTTGIRTYTASSTATLNLKETKVRTNNDGLRLKGIKAGFECCEVINNTRYGLLLDDGAIACLAPNSTFANSGNNIMYGNQYAIYGDDGENLFYLNQGYNNLCSDDKCIYGTFAKKYCFMTLVCNNNQWNYSGTAPGSNEYAIFNADGLSAMLLDNSPNDITIGCGEIPHNPEIIYDLPDGYTPPSTITTSFGGEQPLNEAINTAFETTTTGGLKSGSLGNTPNFKTAFENLQEVLLFDIEKPNATDRLLAEQALDHMQVILGSKMTNDSLISEVEALVEKLETVQAKKHKGNIGWFVKSDEPTVLIELAQSYVFVNNFAQAITVLENGKNDLKRKHWPVIDSELCRIRAQWQIFLGQADSPEELFSQCGCDEEDGLKSGSIANETTEKEYCEEPMQVDFVIFPHPVRDKAKLIVFVPEGQNAALLIYNATGQKVSQQSLYEGETTVELSNTELSVGVYNVVITQDGKVSKAEKMIITK